MALKPRDRADIVRALRAAFPDRAEHLIRELERAMMSELRFEARRRRDTRRSGANVNRSMRGETILEPDVAESRGWLGVDDPTVETEGRVYNDAARMLISDVLHAVAVHGGDPRHVAEWALETWVADLDDPD